MIHIGSKLLQIDLEYTTKYGEKGRFKFPNVFEQKIANCIKHGEYESESVGMPSGKIICTVCPRCNAIQKHKMALIVADQEMIDKGFIKVDGEWIKQMEVPKISRLTEKKQFSYGESN